MSEKVRRQSRILEIIREKEIRTQEELALCLKQEGFFATQATVSRDIRELGLKKSRDTGSAVHYTAITDSGSDPLNETYSRVMKDGIISCEQAQNLLVVKTVSGMAMGVAAALDSMRYPEVVGCIAGDDTIMVACRAPADAQALQGKIASMMKQQAQGQRKGQS